MKENTLATFLNNISYPANTWIRPYDLRYIILNSDANQFYNPKLQKMYFDTTKDLIKVKYSELIPITSILKQFTYSENTNSLYFTNIFQTIYVKKNIREPKSGDVVCCYSKATDTTVRSTINRIISDAYGNKQIELLNNNVINAIKNATSGLCFYIWLQDYQTGISLNNKTEYYTEHDVTEYDGDIYIDINNVSGFNFEANKWGI